MTQSGLLLPMRAPGGAVAGARLPRLVAAAELYWRDPALIFGVDYSQGTRDLVTGALPTTVSTIGGYSALGPGAKTDGTRTGFVYATPPGLAATFAAITVVLVVNPLNINTGTFRYLMGMGPDGDPAMSVVMDTTNLRYGILENAFSWAPNNSLVIGQTNVVIAIKNGTTHTVYIDGVQSMNDTTGSATRSAAVLGIGREGSATTNYASAVISAAMVFNRALTANEAADLSFRLRRQMPDTERFRPQYFVPAGAGGGVNLTPGAGALALTGFAPTVGVSNNQNVLAGVGALSLSGFAPSAAVSNNQNVLAGAGVLTLTGFSPAVVVNTRVLPGVGALTLSGFAPTVALSNNQNVLAGVGALSLAGLAPLVSIGTTVAPGVGVLSLAGFSPTIAVTHNQTVATQTGTLSLTGFSPTVFASNPQQITPGVGQVIVSGFSPSLGITVPIAPPKEPKIFLRHRGDARFYRRGN